MDMARAIISREARTQTACAAHDDEDAATLHSGAVIVAGRSNQVRLVAVLFHQLGDVLAAKGDLDAAVVALEAGVQMLTTMTGVDLERILDLRGIVGPHVCEVDRMSLSNGVDDATDAALTSVIADPMLAAGWLIICAEIYQRQSRPHLAVATYQRALAHLETDDMVELRVSTLTRLGTLAFRQGDVALAQAVLDDLIQLRDQATDLRVQCQSSTALGTLYAVVGDPQQALQVYRQAQRLSLQIGDPILIGHTRGHLVRLATLLHGRTRQRQRQQRRPDPTW